MLLFFLSCYLILYMYIFNKILFFKFLKLKQDRFGYFYKSYKNSTNINLGFFLYSYSILNIFIYSYILAYNFLFEFNLTFIILDYSLIYYLLLVCLFLNSLLFNFYKLFASQFYEFNYLWFYFIIFIFTFFIFYNNNFCLICLFFWVFVIELISIYISGRYIKTQQFKNFFGFNLKKKK